jgi:thioredoxin-related protein
MRFLSALLIAMVFLLPGPTQADTYSAALIRAKKEDKPVVLYFFTRSCAYCAAMDKKVLADKGIANLLRRDLVYVRIDAEKREDLAERYAVWAYPTTWLLEPSGSKITRLMGYVPKAEFSKTLAYLKGKHYRMMDLNEFRRSTK